MVQEEQKWKRQEELLSHRKMKGEVLGHREDYHLMIMMMMMMPY